MPPSLPGTYVLILHLPAAATIAVGALGTLRFPPGYYAYAGSALGPGGLAARVERHIAATRKRHWHVDSLREWARPFALWYATGAERRECTWARALTGLPGASIPAAGFGSSDCRCAAHLVRFSQAPGRTELERACGVALAGGILA